MTLKTVSRIRAIGGSLVVTIPKEVVKNEFLNEGELIELEIRKPKKPTIPVSARIVRYMSSAILKSSSTSISLLGLYSSNLFLKCFRPIPKNG